MAEFSAWLAFSTLVSKCQMLHYYVTDAAANANVTMEEMYGYVAPSAPTLMAACPKMLEFMTTYEDADTDDEDKMGECIAPYGLLMQCTNVFADLDFMRVVGFTNTTDDGTPASMLMVHGQPLLEGCMKVFGAAAEMEKQEEEVLDQAEEVVAVERTTKELRSL